MHISTCKPHGRIWLVLVLVFSGLASAHGADDTWIHIDLVRMKESSEPRILSGNLILSYEDPEGKFVRKVSAAFSHEDYKVQHVFSRNENDVFVCVLPVPEETGTIGYRISVDGHWMADPKNRNVASDQAGVDISLITLDAPIPSRAKSPVVAGDSVTFRYDASPGLLVYLSGTFNRWDPFMYRMKETQGGVYTLTLPMGRGTHHYVYVVNGTRNPDPLNPLRAEDTNGNLVSGLIVQ